MGSPYPGARGHSLRRRHLPCRVEVPKRLSPGTAQDDFYRRDIPPKWLVPSSSPSSSSALPPFPSPSRRSRHRAPTDSLPRGIVYANGVVCISILHPPGDDPNQYEHASERWSPIQSVEKILISVMSMLAEPNDESPANIEAAKMWRENRAAYEQRVRDGVRRMLGL